MNKFSHAKLIFFFHYTHRIDKMNKLHSKTSWARAMVSVRAGSKVMASAGASAGASARVSASASAGTRVSAKAHTRKIRIQGG